MPEHVLTNAAVYAAGYNLSGDLQATMLAVDVDMVDRTRMGASSRSRMPGLINGTWQHEGLWQSGADLVDPELFTQIGLNDQPVTMAAEGADDGEVAFLFKATSAEYTHGGSIGEAHGFSFGGETTEPVVRGTMMHNASRTATGLGTARQLGAVAAGQSVYASLHVFSVSGTLPTLDVIVRSDDNAGMSSPTTRLTFTQATARAGELLSLAVPITDDYWQVDYTIGGTTPIFEFAVCIGIK